ncbi:fibronectin type III domain-containing protein [Collimonas sp.]|uniref:fibronectin type III domain-containing protein n=1 Tax=Collimonas sp. TaxID=1963772 RepID=UPI0039C8BCE2
MTSEFSSIKFSRTPIVKAVENSHDSITVAWSAPIMDRPITAYQFIIRRGAPNGPQLNIEELPRPNNFPPYRHAIRSLTSKTVYYIQVRGIDCGGDASSWSRQQGYRTL